MKVLNLKKALCTIFILSIAVCTIFLVHNTAFAIDGEDGYDEYLASDCNEGEVSSSVYSVPGQDCNSWYLTFNVSKNVDQAMLYGVSKAFCANTKIDDAILNWISYEKDENNNPILKISAWNAQRLTIYLDNSNDPNAKIITPTRVAQNYNTYIYNVPVEEGYNKLGIHYRAEE